MSEFSDASSAASDAEDTVDYVVGLAEAGEWEALPEFLEGAGVDDEDAATSSRARTRATTTTSRFSPRL